MGYSMMQFWFVFGAILVFSEFILPGLVAVFIGMGAFTVVLFLHLKYIDNIAMQLITWFSSSMIYIFSLRLLVMKFYPSDTMKLNIDEDVDAFGKSAIVTEDIAAGKAGRISFGDSTWRALSEDGASYSVGDRVQIVGRENITRIVKKI